MKDVWKGDIRGRNMMIRMIRIGFMNVLCGRLVLELDSQDSTEIARNCSGHVSWEYRISRESQVFFAGYELYDQNEGRVWCSDHKLLLG